MPVTSSKMPRRMFPTDLGDAADEVKVGAEAVAHDIKSVVVPPPPAP